MYNRLIKAVLLLWILVIPIFLSAQVNIPFTRFGLGELHSGNFAINQAMGGTSVGFSSYENINFNNPASYSSFYEKVYGTIYKVDKRDTTIVDPVTGESTIITLTDSIAKDTLIGVVKSTTFESAITGTLYNVRNLTENIQTGNATLGYLAFGFPVPGFGGISAGIMPYSNVEFNLSRSDNVIIDDTLEQKVFRHIGQGGIFQAYLGAAARIKNLSVGINGIYMFGSIDLDNIVYFPNLTNAFGTRSTTVYNVRGLTFNAGAQYKWSLTDDLNLKIGITGKPKTKVTAVVDNSVDRVLVVSNDIFSHLDTIESNNNVKSDLELPAELGFGLLLEKKGDWMVGVDYEMKQWSSVDAIISQSELNNSSRISFGGQIRPDAEGNFLQKTKYRFGAYYATDYLMINNSDLNDYGITFGLGIPIKRDRKNIASSLDLAFQIGQRGSVGTNLISENYFRFTLGFNLNDNSWIFRSKYF